MRSSVHTAFLVARREYRVRVLNRTFAVMSGCAALLGVVLVLLPIVLMSLAHQATTRIAVAAPTPALAAEAASEIGARLSAATAVGTPGATAGTFVVTVGDAASAAANVRAGRLDGALDLARDASGELQFRYVGRGDAGSLQVALVRQAAAGLAVEDRLGRAGFDPAGRASLFAPPAFAFATADADASGSVEDQVSRGLVGFGLNIVIYLAIITYGYWIASSVAEEKGSRVMELLVSAATPDELLVGKVAGAGAAALTQYAALLAGGAVGLLLQGRVSDALVGPSAAATPVASVSLGVLLAFGAYFALGFALYAGLYAAAGAMVGRQQDASQVGMPITMLATVGYMASTFGGSTPDAGWMTALSVIPFSSPSTMLTRLVAGHVTLPEVAASLGLLAAGVVAAFWLAARIYRAAVLQYGQPASLRRLLFAGRSPVAVDRPAA